MSAPCRPQFPTAEHPALPPPCIIFNPTAKGDKARRLGRHLDQLTGACILRPTVGPGSARALATAALREGHLILIAAGGDGTVNEVLNGIGDAPGGFERATLGIIPLGTANVLARELGLPFNLLANLDILRRGRTQNLDLIHVTHRALGKTVQRWMVQLAGAGLDARAVEFVDWKLKKRTGYFAYVVAGMRALLEPSPLIIVSNGVSELSGELVLLGNGRLYGGPFTLFPRADPQDGFLDARVFPRAGWLTALGFGVAALTRQFNRVGNAGDIRGGWLELRSEQRVPLEIDGEGVGELPARFEVAPGRLRVIVP